MSKLKIGDLVMVRNGKWRTKTGTIEKMMPSVGKAIVTGVNIIKKHQKKSSLSPQGGIIERPAPIHLSKLMLVDAKTKKPTRVGYEIKGDKKIRIAKKSGEPVVATKTETK
jgi:large subunit ribosomal protein L24